MARFYREAQAAAKLTHPNIVVIHDIDELEGRHFISMEYLEGKTLDEVTRCVNKKSTRKPIR